MQGQVGTMPGIRRPPLNFPGKRGNMQFLQEKVVEEAHDLVGGGNLVKQLMQVAREREAEFDGPQGAKGKVPDLEAYHWKAIEPYHLAKPGKRLELARRARYFIAAKAVRIAIDDLKAALGRMDELIESARASADGDLQQHDAPHPRSLAGRLANIALCEDLRDEAWALYDELHLKINEVIGGTGYSALILEHEAS